MAHEAGKATPPTDWRTERLARVRALIRQAAPEAVEERKWKKPSNPAGVPTWSDHGIICTGETYKDKVKLTFAKGALVADPHKIFNASLDGNVRRAVDLRQSDKLDEQAFIELVRVAVAINRKRVAGAGCRSFRACV